MIGYILNQRQYRIWSPKQRCIFAQTAINFNKTKSGAHLLNEYPFIATPALSTIFPANLSSIAYTSKKQGRPQKKTGPAIAILDSDVEDVFEPSKKTYLFLKPPRPPPSTDEVSMNVIEVSSKIVELDTYKEAIENPIHIAH